MSRCSQRFPGKGCACGPGSSGPALALLQLELEGQAWPSYHPPMELSWAWGPSSTDTEDLWEP